MSKQKSEILKTVTFPDGSIWEVKEKLLVGLIVHDPKEYLYRHVLADDAGCVISAEEGSIQDKLHHLILQMWDTEKRMTKVLDEVSTIVDGDADWPYMDFIVLSVRQEMEDKKKVETALAEWKRMGDELVQAFGMRLVDGKVAYSCPPDFRWDAFDHMATLLKQNL